MAAFAPVAPAQEPTAWATYRGNVQRTGHTDALPGPATPHILWAMKSQDHFIASPVPHGERLFLSGLGAFNIGTFYALSAEPKARQRVVWSKTTPFLKLPTVSSPSLVKGRVIFGDGMHQTDGATLYCLDGGDGVPLWRHPVPGTLVHLEGSPTILDGKVYIGGGAAGALCVEAESAELDGKTLDLNALHRTMQSSWKQLQAKYEIEKKTDEFAVPPNEDMLPRASPKRLWQTGAERWHVDAPVTVVGDKVLVASAFLDKEKVGERALICLDAKTGKERWKVPLRLNPWGGAAVAGDTVIITGSSIGYYPTLLKGAKGAIAAYRLADGKPLWNKNVPGGIVGCAALADGSAVVTATDGKVRAFALAAGERQWIHDTKTPLFAPPAVAHGTVYVGNLTGTITALDLKAGQKQWSLDLGTNADTKAPGMIYAGPIVHAGRLYVATCNHEGPYARQPTVLVCIGAK